MPTVIVSYRRSDSRWIAGRIVDRLERDLGKGDVFVDIDAIPFGMDFRDHLHGVLGRCDVLLAVIGPNWLATDEAGRPRIFEPTDWVRIEIETALAKGTPVIPVLIDRAPMPKVSELPESLHAFAFRQAADVDTGRDFHVHMDRLVRAIAQSAAAPEHAPSVAPVAEDMSDAPPNRAHEGSRHRGVVAAVVAAAAIAAVAALFTQQWSDRPAVAPSVPAEPASQSRVQASLNQAPLNQAPPDTPDLTPASVTASPSDQPSTLDAPPAVNPLPLDPPPALDTPVPSDRPVPPASIGQPQAQPQRALLFESDKEDSNGLHFNGSVTWRTVRTSSFGQLPGLAAIADIAVPDRKLVLTMSLRLNTDPNLPASHTIEVVFKLPGDFAPGGVSNVPGVLMKNINESRGTALAGLSTEVRPGVFLIGLSAAGSDRVRNLQLLRERAWFDIPIVYSNGTRAVLTVEKGAAGERVFAEAFAAWRQ
jgi:hypothetical protein